MERRLVTANLKCKNETIDFWYLGDQFPKPLGFIVERQSPADRDIQPVISLGYRKARFGNLDGDVGPVIRCLFVIIFAILLSRAPDQCVAAELLTESASDDAIIRGYRLANNGYSADEILINDELRHGWLAAVDPAWIQNSEDWQARTSLRLLSLRKAGKLPAITSKRGRPVRDDVLPIAEIAARSVLDQYNVSSDELLCTPRLREQLQSSASNIAADIDPYDVRKAVLRLRKTRQLRPELTLRVADWKRTIEVFTREDLVIALKTRGRISLGAGVYLFRDVTGYLYIGEAVNLHQRLTQHLAGSDRLSFQAYLDSVAEGAVTVELHSFESDSPANELSIRRAYESELIRTREPRLNLRP